MYKLKLKEMRQQRGLSLGQLSELTGLSKSMLSDIENGRSSPTIKTVNKLARVLGPQVLVWEEDKHGRG